MAFSVILICRIPYRGTVRTRRPDVAETADRTVCNDVIFNVF